jgi:SAM-dependent methyltransferase
MRRRFNMIQQHLERQRMIRAWAAHDAQIYRRFTDTLHASLPRASSELHILDLGCGSNAPMTVLLHAAGYRVTGVDGTLGFRWGLGFRFNRYRKYAKDAGLARAVRKALGEAVYDREYYRHLSALTGLQLTDAGLDLRAMDIQRPQLPANTFDVIHSNATWEHIPDVKAANVTLANALKPGGVAYIEIHLFPSLSGGHDLPWIVPGQIVLGDVLPWQHLRKADWQAPVYLNRLRERDYRRLFVETPGLVIEDWVVEFTEGESLVTPEIRQALPDYSVEELTKRSIIAVLRKADVATTHRGSRPS